MVERSQKLEQEKPELTLWEKNEVNEISGHCYHYRQLIALAVQVQGVSES